MKLKWFLLTGLIGLVAWSSHTLGWHFVATPTCRQEPSVPVAAAATHRSDPIPQVIHPAATFAADVRGWADLECADYREYIRRLRAFGCPERTIRDLVVTDLHAVIAQEQSRLLQANMRRVRRSEVGRREIAKALADIADRERSTLASLLGPRWSEGLSYRLDPPSIDDSFVDWLSPEVGERVQAIEQAYATWEAEFEAVRASLRPEEVKAALQTARRDRDAQLQEWLTEEEWTDLELTTSDTGRSLIRTAEQMNLSESELTELLRLERGMDAALGELDGVDDAEATGESWRLLEETDEARQRLLGPERAQVYEGLKSPIFSEIYDLARENGLEGELANRAYRLHESLVSSVEALVDEAPEPSMTDAGEIARVRQEILGQLGGILGNEGLAAYESRVLAKDPQLVGWLNLGESAPGGTPPAHP